MMVSSAERNQLDVSTVESHTNLTLLMEWNLRPLEYSDPLVSAHTSYIIRTVLNCYIQQFILIFGIPGNMICCIVFLKQGLSDRINLLLFSLAVADLINLVMLFMLYFRCYIERWDQLQANNWIIIMGSGPVYVGLWANFVSGALIVIMSVDRCLSVAMPLKAGRLLSFRPMLAAIIMVYLGFLVFHLPVMLVNMVNWKVDPSTNHSIAYLAIAEWFVLDSNIAYEIRTVVSTIFKPVFVIVIIICCIITIAKLRQASRKRIQMQEIGKQESGGGGGGGGGGDSRINKMLLFLCVVYVIFFLPNMANLITYYFVPEFYAYRKFHNTFLVVSAVMLTASCLNSTVNFFTYLVLSSKFRTTLRELCQCCGGRPLSWVRRRQKVQATQNTMSQAMISQW